MEAKIYNTQAKEVGKIDLPESIFGLPWNPDLVHQAVETMQANARHGNAHTKDRGEVRGGGKKPWRQKGTGRARHGSTRSPIWVGGGVAHGPRNTKDYSKKLNRKMAGRALLVALSQKLRDGEVIFVDSLEMTAPSAKEAKAFLSAFAQKGFGVMKRKNAALVALPAKHDPTFKSFGNFGNVTAAEVRNLNPVSVLSAKYLVIANPAAAIEVLSKKKAVKSN
jgi:large subunit ribosomal protein L4